jgi:hypothetical protein
MKPMTAEEYFNEYWKEANKDKFGDYGEYNSDEYAIAFAEDYHKTRVESITDEDKDKAAKENGLDNWNDKGYCEFDEKYNIGFRNGFLAAIKLLNQ